MTTSENLSDFMSDLEDVSSLEGATADELDQINTIKKQALEIRRLKEQASRRDEQSDYSQIE